VQVDGDWESTQTVAPTGVTVTGVTGSSATLQWTPILYTGDGGGYRVYAARSPGGPADFLGMTANKSATGMTVTGLWSGTTYYFTVRTQTDPHPNNQNTVLSDPSPEVPGTTTGSPPVTHSLTVAKTGGGDGLVISTPTGIYCGSTCTEDFLANSTVTLHAEPDGDSVFFGWSGGGCGGNGDCQVTMTSDLTVTAIFEPAAVFIFWDGFESGDTSQWSNSVP